MPPALVEPGPPLSAVEVERYSRHVLLPALEEVGQRRLRRARVCVVGAGGLGSPAVLYLTAAGVGTLGIVDDDEVELSNLARQVVHDTASIGTPKVDSAVQRLAQLDPGVTVRRHRVRLTADNAADVLRDYDLVVDGSDNFPTRYAVDDACTLLGTPLVWGAVLGFDAQVTVFWGRPPAASDVAPISLRDLVPEEPAAGVASCAEAGVLGALCGQVGSLLAIEAVKLITGIGTPLLGRALVLDALAARCTEVPLRRAASSAGAPLPRTEADEPRTSAASNSEMPLPHAPATSPASAQAAVTTPPRSDLDAQALADALLARDAGSADFLLLDVREPAETAECSIPGSTPVPLASLLTETGRTILPRQLPIVVYCQSGARSEVAVSALRAAGFGPVSSLAGGIKAWLRHTND